MRRLFISWGWLVHDGLVSWARNRGLRTAGRAATIRPVYDLGLSAQKFTQSLPIVSHHKMYAVTKGIRRLIPTIHSANKDNDKLKMLKTTYN
ncbi:MAG: hypothetical protein JWN38_696 [Candidatus Saccharibacteria bacterium]|nr:hypothetical protein [Candidatus Saccharibacteria bacterium]